MLGTGPFICFRKPRCGFSADGSKGFTLTSVGTAVMEKVDSTCMLAYGFSLMVPFEAQKIASKTCVSCYPADSQLIYDFGIGILFQTVEVTPSTERQGYRGYPTICQGLVHPNPV